MAEFKYRAMLRDGTIVRGRMESISKSEIILKLKNSKIQPIEIRKLNRSTKIKRRNSYRENDMAKLMNFAREKNSKKKTFKAKTHGRVQTKDILVFTNNLYILKKANFNNIQALESLYYGTENSTLRDIVEDILIGVEAGDSIHATMQYYQHVFPPIFINFVKVGEESGSLATALMQARDYLESSMELKKKLKSIILPKVIEFTSLIILMFIGLLAGVPMIQSVYDMFNSQAEIPVATRVAVDIATFMVSHWYIFVGLLGIIILLFYMYRSTPKGRYNVDRFLLTMPLAGPLQTNILLHKFFQAMLLNLRNGMRIQESIDISKSITNNFFFLSLIETAKSNLIAGQSWIEPFEKAGMFRPMVTEMLNIGMQTDITEMMEKVAEYINLEINESMDKIVKTLPDITYALVGVLMIIFLIVLVVPLIDVYMGSFLYEV